MTKSIDEILGQIPEELRNKLRIEVNVDEFSINGLETIIIVRNPVDIIVYTNKSADEKQYSIKTKNGGEFVVSNSGSTFVTIV